MPVLPPECFALCAEISQEDKLDVTAQLKRLLRVCDGLFINWQSLTFCLI